MAKFYNVIRGTQANHVVIGDKIENKLVALVRRDNINRQNDNKHHKVLFSDTDKGVYEIVED
jgi:hypothetical protein